MNTPDDDDGLLAYLAVYSKDTPQRLTLYRDSLIKFLTAKKQYPDIDHGPEPSALDFLLDTDIQIWAAGRESDRVKREMERTI